MRPVGRVGMVLVAVFVTRDLAGRSFRRVCSSGDLSVRCRRPRTPRGDAGLIRSRSGGVVVVTHHSLVVALPRFGTSPLPNKEESIE